MSVPLSNEKSPFFLKVKSENIFIPEEVPTQDIISKVKDTFASYPQELNSYPWETPLYDLPSIVFHSDEASALSLKNEVEASGFKKIECQYRVEEILNILYSRPIGNIFLWYDQNKTESLTLLQAISEARDLPRHHIVVLVPEKNPLDQFNKAGGHLLYDKILILNRGDRNKFHEEMKLCFEHYMSRIKGVAIIASMRIPFKLGNEKNQKIPIELSELNKLASSIQTDTRLNYWSKAEPIPHLVVLNQLEEAKKKSEELLKTYPTIFDGKYLNALVTAKTKNPSEGGKIIAQALIEQNQIPKWRFVLSTRNLIKWGAVDALQLVLEKWITLFPKDDSHFFCFAMASYLQLKKIESQIQKNYLKKALFDAPLRSEYLMALANYFDVNKEYRRVEEILMHGQRAYLMSRHSAWLLLARSFFQQRKPRFAQETLEKVLREDIENKTALKFKMEFGL